MGNVTGNLGRWMFERNGNAVASLLLGAAGLLAFGVILGPIAIGLGVLAKRQITTTGQPGTGTASIGIALGIVALAIPILLLIL